MPVNPRKPRRKVFSRQGVPQVQSKPKPSQVQSILLGVSESKTLDFTINNLPVHCRVIPVRRNLKPFSAIVTVEHPTQKGAFAVFTCFFGKPAAGASLIRTKQGKTFEAVLGNPNSVLKQILKQLKSK